MKGSRNIAVVMFLQLFFHFGISQENELDFILVNGPEGKALGHVRNITQDKFGYIWFAAQNAKCIYRYDGNRFIVFRHDDANPNSLGGTSINSIYADDEGMIWIGMGEGLDQYNPANGIFKHFIHLPNDSGSLSGGLMDGDVNNALATINKTYPNVSIRSRAGMTQFTLAEMTLENMLAERGRELSWEGFRRNDLIRFGHFLDARIPEKSVSPSYRTLYPIPKSQMDMNPYLVQNPGY